MGTVASGATPAQSLDVVQAAYDASGCGDGAAFLALFAEGAVVQQGAGLPWVTVPEGEPFEQFASRAGSYIRSRQTIDEMFASGDDVIVIGRSRGEAVRTGKQFDVRIVHRWTVRDGLIHRWQLMVEQAPLLEALTP